MSDHEEFSTNEQDTYNSLTDQSDFEKWIQKEKMFAEDQIAFKKTALLARDWFLSKADELSLDVYNYDCKMLPLHKLEKACK